MRIVNISTIRPRMAQAQGMDEFSNVIMPEVRLSSEGTDIRQSWTDIMNVSHCELKYRIDVEYRNWGIKDIGLFLDQSPIVVEVQIKTESGPDDNPTVQEGTKQVVVDPSKIKVNLTSGSSVALTAMELYLNADFTVDYSLSEISGTTLMRVEE